FTGLWVVEAVRMRQRKMQKHKTNFFVVNQFMRPPHQVRVVASVHLGIRSIRIFEARYSRLAGKQRCIAVPPGGPSGRVVPWNFKSPCPGAPVKRRPISAAVRVIPTSRTSGPPFSLCIGKKSLLGRELLPSLRSLNRKVPSKVAANSRNYS